MTQFPKRNTQPLRPDSYSYCARQLRKWADRIEVCGDPQSPRELAALTRAVRAASGFMREFSERHTRKWELWK